MIPHVIIRKSIPARAGLVLGFVPVPVLVALVGYGLIGCCLIGGSLVGCDTDAVLLPPDFNESKVKVISVDYAQEEGPVVRLSGLQGGVVPTIVGDQNLVGQFKLAVADLIRLPGGYLCNYTVSGTFPNRTRPVDDPASYDFERIDPIYQGLLDLAPVGGEPPRRLYQAMFDLGLDTCSVNQNGVQSGTRPQDMTAWTTVVVNILRHFNKSLLDENNTDHAPWIAGAQDFGVRYVEYYADPMGRGGYTSVTDLADDFGAFAGAVKAAFPNVGDEAVISVVGPSMVIEEGADIASHPIAAFLTEMATRGTLANLDVVSFEVRAGEPAEAARIANDLRAFMTAQNIDKPLWATRFQPTEGRAPTPTQDSQVADWSILSGAWATATRIMWQGTVDAAVFYRGDRRHLTVDGNDLLRTEASPLWDGRNGAWRPAGIATQPWNLMAGDGKVRVAVNPLEAPDNKGLAVLAVKEAMAPCGDGESSETNLCPNLFLLVANTNTDLGQANVEYQLNIRGLDGADRQVTVHRASIDIGTDRFSFISATGIKVPVIDGKLFHTFDSAVPSVQFLQIDLH